MARIAFVSDLHADAAALCDALLSIERLGIDEIWCAGDLVDEGDDADEVIRLLDDRGIPTILGNHDRWALEKRATGRPAHAFATRSWRFLEERPRAWWSARDGVRIAMHHGSPLGDMDALDAEHLDAARARSLLDRAEADVLVVGHTHAPMLVHVGARLIVNPGALWRAGTRVGGTFGVLDIQARRFFVHEALGRPVDLAAR